MIAGTVYMYAGATAPSGYLLCDGSNVSRTTYATLFDAIGTTFGAGDGSTTFGLPNLSGKIVIGTSSSHALASTGGEETHALTTTEIPSHLHQVPTHGHGHTITATTPSFSHSITQPAYNYNKPNSTRSIYTASGATAYSGTTNTAATRTNLSIADHAATACTMSGSIANKAAFTMDNNGSGTAHSNMQPYLTLNYIIATGD